MQRSNAVARAAIVAVAAALLLSACGHKSSAINTPVPTTAAAQATAVPSPTPLPPTATAAIATTASLSATSTAFVATVTGAAPTTVPGTPAATSDPKAQ